MYVKTQMKKYNYYGIFLLLLLGMAGGMMFSLTGIDTVMAEDSWDQKTIDSLLSTAARDRMYAEEKFDKAKKYQNMAKSAEVKAKQSRNQQYREGWLKDAEEYRNKALKFEEEAAKFMSQADAKEKEAGELAKKLADKQEQEAMEEQANQDAEEERAAAREDALKEKEKRAEMRISLQEILGSWRISKEERPFEIVQVNPDYFPNKLKGITDERVWEGFYTSADKGDIARSQSARVVFKYKPKAEEMNPTIPLWARSVVEGKLEWKLELEEDMDDKLDEKGDVIGQRKLNGKWFVGEVKWNAELEGAQGGADDAQVMGPGDAREISLIKLAECQKEDSVCAEQCTKKFWRWNFFVTQYNVGGSLGLGEHQGIYIIGNEYQYDERYPASKSKVSPTWKVGSDFAKIVENPGVNKSNKLDDKVSEFALCKHTVLHQRNFYNHGRTIARNLPDDVKFRFTEGAVTALRTIGSGQLPITSLSTIDFGPLKYHEWSSDNHDEGRKARIITYCMEEITDGYCDSVCGNCSYVLPELDLKVTKGGTVDKGKNLTNQRTAFTLMEGEGAKRHKVFYMRQGKNHADAIWERWTVKASPIAAGAGSKRFKDPFTHCYDKKADYPTQMVSTRLQWVGNQRFRDFEDRERVVTGMYGHNSNTDAEAELRQFNSCGLSPKVKPGSACNVCGIPRKENGKNVQWPCLHKTNEAKAKWAVTDGMHNVNDSKLGSLPAKAPQCANTQYKVPGM